MNYVNIQESDDPDFACDWNILVSLIEKHTVKGLRTMLDDIEEDGTDTETSV